MKRSYDTTRLVVYDVDGTLLPDTPDELTGRALWELNNAGVFHSPDETLETLELLRSEAMATDDELIRKDYRSLVVQEFDQQIKDAPIARVKRVMQDMVEHDVAELMHRDRSDELDYWRQEGAVVAMISGSPDVCIQALKKALHLPVATGTRYHVKQGLYRTDRPAETRGRDKHLIAESMMRKLGGNVVLHAAYGDTVNDLTLLDMAEQAYAIDPKPDLRAVAEARGYVIKDTLDDTARVAA